jgi:excisionase family DNA binding protein
MQGQIFEIGGGGLKRIVDEAVAIGQRVYHSGYVSGEAVVCGKDSIGYEIIFPDGHSCNHQRLDSLSPYTKMKLREGIADADEIAGLIAKRDAKRAADRLAQENKRNQHAVDVARITKELQSKYPFAAKQTGSGRVRASRNIKVELSQVFPGVKFSVRSESYSGGNSVDVSWTDGPTTKQVEAITGKYQDGSFNGMEDIYEHDRSAFGEAVSSVLGRAKYVMEQRSYSAGLYEAIGRELCRLQRVEFNNLNQHNLFGEHSEDLQWYVHQLICETAIPVGASFVRAESAGSGAHGWNEWATLIFETPQPEASAKPCPLCGSALRSEGNSYSCTSCAFKAVVKAQNVTIAENEEKSGIEIRFASKPSGDVLSSLKSAGWRWSRFNSCWYNKATTESREFAQGLTAMNKLTVSEVAKRLSLTPRRVRALIQAKRLPAKKTGRDWQIKESDLPCVADRKPGRPRKHPADGQGE